MKGQLAKTQQRVFDDLSRLLQSINADGNTTEYQYDQAGKPIVIIDGMNHRKALAYDGLNRLIRSSDTSGDIVKTYDTASRVTSITDQRGLTTQYRYNGFGEKIEQISPDTGSSHFKYDLAGRMIEKADARGEVTQFRHDVIGRVTDVIYPAANDENIHYVYDAYQPNQSHEPSNDATYLVGRLAEVHQSTGASYYAYNHRGQVAKHYYSIDAQQYSQEYHYAKGGKLEQMTYPSGRVVNYQQNNQGRLAEVTTLRGDNEQLIANRFEAMPFGAYSGFAYGNGSEVNVLRDLNFRITDIRVNSQSQNDALYNVGFDYDKASNITAISDYTASARNQQFIYDESNRLVQASGHYGDMRYDYDGVGNRLSREINRPMQGDGTQEIQQETYTYAQDSNRLLSVASTTNDGGAKQRDLAYDAVGNIVQDGKTNAEKTLQYSARNRLKQVDLNESGDTVIYLYNVKGERISKQVKGVTTHFHYDLSGRMIAENVDDTELASNYREFIYGAGRHLATVGAKVSEPQAINFVVTDQLGTPQMLLDSLEQVVWQRDASPFGEVALANVSSEQLFGFPGQYHDVDTGYAYNYFRDYDASLGRYIQSDPIGLGGGVNTFGYVANDPMNKRDFYGLDWTIGQTKYNTPQKAKFAAQTLVSGTGRGTVIYLQNTPLHRMYRKFGGENSYYFTQPSPRAHKNQHYTISANGIAGAKVGAQGVEGAVAVVIDFNSTIKDTEQLKVNQNAFQRMANDTGLEITVGFEKKDGGWQTFLPKDCEN